MLGGGPGGAKGGPGALGCGAYVVQSTGQPIVLDSIDNKRQSNSSDTSVKESEHKTCLFIVRSR